MRHSEFIFRFPRKFFGSAKFDGQLCFRHAGFAQNGAKLSRYRGCTRAFTKTAELLRQSRPLCCQPHKFFVTFSALTLNTLQLL